MSQILEFPTVRTFWTNHYSWLDTAFLAQKRHPVFQEIIYSSFSATLYYRGTVPYWLIDVHYRAVGVIVVRDYSDGEITQLFDMYEKGDFLPHHWIEIKPRDRLPVSECLRYTVDKTSL